MSLTPPSSKKLLQVSLLLVGGFCFFLVYLSHWYWECKAQLDPATLMPVTCRDTNSNRISPECEERLWPTFGECNDNFEGLSNFWEDDLISTFFAILGNVAGDAARPILRDTIVPTWNAVFRIDKNRDLVIVVIGAIPGAVIGFLIKDVYDHFMNNRQTDR
jgi:hypothetical protein